MKLFVLCRSDNFRPARMCAHTPHNIYIYIYLSTHYMGGERDRERERERERYYVSYSIWCRISYLKWCYATVHCSDHVFVAHSDFTDFRRRRPVNTHCRSNPWICDLVFAGEWSANHIAIRPNYSLTVWSLSVVHSSLECCILFVRLSLPLSLSLSLSLLFSHDFF